MKKKNKRILLIGILCLVVVLLFWGRMTGSTTTYADTDIACLPGGHQNAQQHVHAGLTITEDGQEVPIPANTGITSTCMAEIHTHDSTGTIHIESTDPDKTYTLSDVFTVLDRELRRDTYDLALEVNGTTSDAYGDLVIQDEQRIAIHYTRATSTSEDVSTTTDSDAQ